MGTYFYKQLVGEKFVQSDFEDAFPDCWAMLHKFLHWSPTPAAAAAAGETFEDVMSLAFEISSPTITRSKSKSSTTHLLPPNCHVVPMSKDIFMSGSDINVSIQNRQLYVDNFMNHRCLANHNPIIASMLAGFWNICPAEVMQMFTGAQFREYVCNDSNVIDMAAIVASFVYEKYDNLDQNSEFYAQDGKYINQLKNILLIRLSSEEQVLFWQFVTAYKTHPSKDLGIPKITIHNMRHATGLPTAYTCSQTLLLPFYATELELEQKIKIAIQFGVGFGLA
jgi:hypothetical protein